MRFIAARWQQQFDEARARPSPAGEGRASTPGAMDIT